MIFSREATVAILVPDCSLLGFKLGAQLMLLQVQISLIGHS